MISRRSRVTRSKKKPIPSKEEIVHQIPASPTIDLEAVLKRIQQRSNQASPPSDLDLVGVAIGCTKDHDKLKSECVRDCIDCLSSDPHKTFDQLLVTDPIAHLNGTVTKVPRFLSSLSGPKTPVKQAIVNKLLTYWQSVTKKKDPKKGKEQFFCWYQPVTQSQRLRTFFAHAQKEFGWQWSIDDFKKRHMLAPFLEKLYEQRLKQYGHVGYGKVNRKRRLSEADMQKISLALFDENIPIQHLMKILFGLGGQCGFRGEEYVILLLMHLCSGIFEVGHPLEGLEWYGFSGFTDKTCKLTYNNPHVRTDEKFMRFPVLENDPSSLGAAIKRLLPKLAPGQNRLFCKVMDEKARANYVRAGGDPQVCFYASCPMGKATISKLFKDGAAILGLKDPEDFYPHSLRAMFITQLANNENVNLEELMRSARHKSASSSANYMQRSGLSETNKFRALGMNLPDTEGVKRAKLNVDEGKYSTIFFTKHTLTSYYYLPLLTDIHTMFSSRC